MSPEETERWFHCTKKVAITTAEKAKRHARQRRKISGHLEIEAYRCKFDPTHFHVGHHPLPRVKYSPYVWLTKTEPFA